MIERLCSECDKPVKGKLFKGMCRTCYDKNRQITVVSVPKKIQPLFEEFMKERRAAPSRCINELVEMGLRTWKHGKWVRIVPREDDDDFQT